MAYFFRRHLLFPDGTIKLPFGSRHCHGSSSPWAVSYRRIFCLRLGLGKVSRTPDISSHYSLLKGCLKLTRPRTWREGRSMYTCRNDDFFAQQLFVTMMCVLLCVVLLFVVVSTFVCVCVISSNVVLLHSASIINR